MRISEAWLREFVDANLSTEQLSDYLTLAGLEIEAVDKISVDFSDVVVAKVLSSEKVSGADKLLICQIDDGTNEIKQAICGADNVRDNHFYPYAKVGSSIAGGQIIEKKTIRNIASEGMLCSAKELGLSDTSSGLYEIDKNVAPGLALQECLSMDDMVFDISITPNRGDCLSVIGLARELSVLTRSNFKEIVASPVEVNIDDIVKINIAEFAACPRYCGRVIKGIDANAVTPVWVQERLRRSGIRSINIVVDFSNYVMLEMGQPMHAFDLQKLSGEISVRLAKKQEKLDLLDGEEYLLKENTLVISDDSGAIAMAGIMGGEATGVTQDTKSVFLESAYFSPAHIMGRARQYGLHTDASHRFERGVDPQPAEMALERLSSLLIEFCGGNAGPIVNVSSEKNLPDRQSISLRKVQVKRLLGIKISDSRIGEILENLGFGLTVNDIGWLVTVPSYRFDIESEVDLIEEIARIHGYDQINESLPAVRMNLAKKHDRQRIHLSLVHAMTDMGYTEVINYSFVDKSFQAKISGDADELCLLNPISSELAVMRKSLLPGLLSTLQFNVKRQQNRLRIFEIGRCFNLENGQIQEDKLLSGLAYGNIDKKQWGTDEITSDFYHIKSDVESILGQFLDAKALSYENSDIQALHPHQNAKIFYKNQNIGYIGMVNPQIQQSLELVSPTFIFELDIAGLPAEKSLKYVKISKYPSIRRDISIIVDEKLPAINVINCIEQEVAGLLDNLELFDVYQGEGIDLEKKSLALGLTFRRSSSTLTDEEADVVISNVLISLHNQFGAILRE